MKFFKITKIYKTKKKIFNLFVNQLWFIPSDIMQRSMEANIWELCTFKNPVLEIGIGNGLYTKMLFGKHKQFAVGIDIEKSGLEIAKATKRYKKVLCVNANNMPFKDASFNTVVSNSTFEHIMNDMKAISEVSRVLKKGGLFFITVPTKNLNDWVLQYENRSNDSLAKERLESFNARANHLHYYSLNEWVQNLKKNKMEVIFSKYYFPRDVAIFWYKLFCVFTYKIKGRELWSYIGHSKLTKIIPKDIIVWLLTNIILKNAYFKGFLINNDTTQGAQVFIVAKKSN